ncbi:MAG: catalase family protein [Caldimonas sp.]
MTPDPAIRALHYSDDVERPENDEDKTTAGLIEALRQIAEKTLSDTGHAMRGVHAKSQGVLIGELRVLDGLAPELAQGLFATPGRYPVVMRLSTSPGDLIDDRISTPRGMGLKVMGVSGERLPGSEGDATQDFVLVDGPAFGAPDAKHFLTNVKLLVGTTDRAEGLKRVLSAVLQGAEKAVESVGTKSSTLIALGGHPETHVLGATYYSQAALRHGDYMAKLSVVPVSPDLTALVNARVDLHDKPDGLREAVQAFFAAHGGEWEVRVQLCTDLEAMPIENPTVVWPEDLSPYRAVARITVAAQPSWSPQRAFPADDRLAFSPWHGLAAHRPLGSIMRVRKAVYEASASFRATQNHCPIHEPRSLEDLAL